MDILNKLNLKPAWVKQGAYLVAAFNMAIDTHTNDTVSVAVIVIFDHYREISLKQATTVSTNVKMMVRIVY